MKRAHLIVSGAAGAAILVSSAAAASAQVSGPWHVSGKVSGFAFTLNCDFKPEGERLGGVCVDGSTNDARVKAGKSHPLTAGRVDGDAVSFTYRSSFMLSKFDVTYRGILVGGRIKGSVSAGGREGTFIASRP